jgi:hypothetical protein
MIIPTAKERGGRGWWKSGNMSKTDKKHVVDGKKIKSFSGLSPKSRVSQIMLGLHQWHHRRWRWRLYSFSKQTRVQQSFGQICCLWRLSVIQTWIVIQKNLMGELDEAELDQLRTKGEVLQFATMLTKAQAVAVEVKRE